MNGPSAHLTPPGPGERDSLTRWFGLEGRVAVVTGGSGALGGSIAAGLAAVGVRVAVLGRRREALEATVASIESAGGTAMALPADVVQQASLESAADQLGTVWGRPSILVNAAGGNRPDAFVRREDDPLRMSVEAFRAVVELNLTGTMLSAQVFGSAMDQGEGSIVNISSLAAGQAISGVGGYGSAKAAVESFTRWLAVELGQRHRGRLRVNAITPGFFVGDQNRSLLLRPDGGPTERGQRALALTPFGRFGDPSELVATVLWLCGPGASFVTGAVVPVDGGFAAFSGV